MITDPSKNQWRKISDKEYEALRKAQGNTDYDSKTMSQYDFWAISMRQEEQNEPFRNLDKSGTAPAPNRAPGASGNEPTRSGLVQASKE